MLSILTKICVLHVKPRKFLRATFSGIKFIAAFDNFLNNFYEKFFCGIEKARRQNTLSFLEDISRKTLVSSKKLHRKCLYFITKDLNNIFLNFLMIEKLFYCTINKSFHLRDKPKKRKEKTEKNKTLSHIS